MSKGVLMAIWVGGMVWAVVVFNQFYQVQPFRLSTIFTLLLPDNLKLVPTWPTFLDQAGGLVWGLMVLGSAVFLGRLITKSTLKSTASAMEIWVISAGLGYGVLAYLTLALGTFGLFYRSVFRIGIGFIFIAGVIWFSLRSERDIIRRLAREKAGLFFSSGRNLFLALILMFISATNLIMAFVPELFYDALVYHLGVPNYYLQEHRLAFLDVMHSKFPFTVQMIHLIGLALKDEMVTRLNHVFMLLMTMGGMIALGFRFQKPRLGLVGAVLYASIPTVQLIAMTSGVDVGVSLFGFLAVYALMVSFEDEENSWPWFIISAVFSGLSVASKYNAVPLVAALFLVITYVDLQKRKPASLIIKRWMVMGGIILLVMAPWLIKNWWEMKDPVYPFLTDFFPGPKIDAWRYHILRVENYGLPIDSIKNLLTVFWKLSVEERTSLSFQGPLLLAAGPFLLYAWKKERPEWFKRLILASVFFVPMALFMTRLTRYWMPGLTLLSLVMAMGITSLLEDPSWIRRISALLVVGMGVWFQMSWVYLNIHGSYHPRDVLLGLESREQFVSYYHPGMNPNPSVPMYTYLKKNLDPESKVLLVGEEKAYPIQVRFKYSGVYDRGPLVRLSEMSQTPDELAQNLAKEGITHIMVNLAEAHRIGGYGLFTFSPPAFGVFCAFWEKHLEFVHIENVPIQEGITNPIVLFKIATKPGAPTRPPFQNIIGPMYEKMELNRLGIKSDAELKAFYEPLHKQWPQVLYFKERLAFFTNKT